ncbi:MAG TPA: hypothetical protein VFG23_22620 [Polyangia bacterium]|nr:hypothetical protein [Polyangia bacterium]
MKNRKHPNRIPFEGCLTKLDVASDRAPFGARGHRVILTWDAANDALDSLLGMAVGFKAEWDGHDNRRKCGVIEEAWIENDELLVSGYLYGKDFPEVIAHMQRPDVELGMSYEMIDARVQDMRAELWTLTAVTFTGAAILMRDKAAYRSTSVNLAAAAASQEFTGALAFFDGGRVQLAERQPGRMHRWYDRLRNGRGSH